MISYYRIGEIYMEIIIFIILGIAIIILLSYPFIAAQKQIENWASENDNEIEEKEARFFRTGPFFILLTVLFIDLKS